MHVSAIIAAAGRGARFGGDLPKQLLTLGGRSVLQRSVEAFLESPRVDDVVVALPSELVADPPLYLRNRGVRLRLIAGGERRQDSVANAFHDVQARADLVIIHDAARPLVSGALIAKTIDVAAATGAAIAALPATDTVKRGSADRIVIDTMPRNEVFLAQTPQAFRIGVLRRALAVEGSAEATDEAMLVERSGHPISLVEGDSTNIKITTQRDLEIAERLIGPSVPRLRIGHGYDLHRLVTGRPLILGGVHIPFDKGLEGHSDADAVCHAVTDAILAPAGLGDIGRMFPDTELAWRGADSLDLLTRAVAAVNDAGHAIINVDAVVIAQRPKLVPYLDAMQANIAQALGVSASSVSIKGKTNEGVDSMGKGESIAVHAVALLQSVMR